MTLHWLDPSANALNGIVPEVTARATIVMARP
jgi:hypothetical protein